VTGSTVESEFSPAQFTRVASFIEDSYGIRIPPEKKIMVESRLARRVRETGCHSIDEYIIRVLDSAEGQAEISRMTDLVSTHMTSFFREPSHFEILARDILPALVGERDYNHQRPLLAWSAACSTGEEA
jgi:chemotaxis protein methyltransferase CheR